MSYICGYCLAPIGSSAGCPSCEPVARLLIYHEASCYAFLVLGLREKPDGYDAWLRARYKAPKEK